MKKLIIVCCMFFSVSCMEVEKAQIHRKKISVDLEGQEEFQEVRIQVRNTPTHSTTSSEDSLRVPYQPPLKKSKKQKVAGALKSIVHLGAKIGVAAVKILL